MDTKTRRARRSRPQLAAPVVLAAVLASLAACGDIYLGSGAKREFPKEMGPLTVPPAAVRDGVAR